MIPSSNQPGSPPEKDKSDTSGIVGPQTEAQKKADLDKVKDQDNNNTKS